MLFHLFLARGVFFREEAFLQSFWLFFFWSFPFRVKDSWTLDHPFFSPILDWLKLAQLFIDRTDFFFSHLFWWVFLLLACSSLLVSCFLFSFFGFQIIFLGFWQGCHLTLRVLRNQNASETPPSSTNGCNSLGAREENDVDRHIPLFSRSPPPSLSKHISYFTFRGWLELCDWKTWISFQVLREQICWSNQQHYHPFKGCS